ncbi:MAG: polyvinylalcohol dehydrogenase, partial [Rhodopirellula sp. JB044]
MKNACASFLALFGVLISFYTASVSAEDWRQWRGDDRANRSSETGLFATWGEDGPPLKWMAEGLGSGYASVSVADGVIYTTGDFEDNQAAVALR